MTHSYELERRDRKSVRLKGYDYAQAGAYFVTIVVQGRAPLFGSIVDAVMHPNSAGMLIQQAWEKMPDRFPAITMDMFVVMPNHVHGIIVLDETVGASLVGAQGTDTIAGQWGEIRATTRVAPTLGEVVGAYKSITTVEYARRVKADEWPPFEGRVWQRNYFERVIRGEDELARARKYIANNPLDWASDSENPERTNESTA